MDGLFRFRLSRLAYPPEPYYQEVFLAKNAINFVFIVLLWVAALFLWKLKRTGLWLANLVFWSEIVYFVAGSWVGLSLDMSGDARAQAIGHAMGASGGTGNMGIAVQLITGFPVVGLIVLGVAYRRLRRAEVVVGQ